MTPETNLTSKLTRAYYTGLATALTTLPLYAQNVEHNTQREWDGRDLFLGMGILGGVGILIYYGIRIFNSTDGLTERARKRKTYLESPPYKETRSSSRNTQKGSSLSQVNSDSSNQRDNEPSSSRLETLAYLYLLEQPSLEEHAKKSKSLSYESPSPTTPLELEASEPKKQNDIQPLHDKNPHDFGSSNSHHDSSSHHSSHSDHSSSYDSGSSFDSSSSGCDCGGGGGGD
jgi:hypothetical protein